MRNNKLKHYFKTVLLTLSTVSLCNISLANHHKGTKMNSDKDKVASTVQVMTKAFHNKDMDNIIASYEKGAAIMFEPGTAVTDAEMIKEMFEGFFQINPKFTYPKGHEVYSANDIALHIAPWVMTGKAPDGTDIEQ